MMIDGNVAAPPRRRGAVATTPGKRRARLQGGSWQAWALLAPAALGFTVFYLVPGIRSIYFSLTDSSLLGSGSFVGLKNYIDLFHDKALLNAVIVTVVYVVINIVVQTVVSLAIAVCLDRFTTSIALRALLLLPWLIPGVTVGLLWEWMLDPSIGIINETLSQLGLGKQMFLSSTSQAMPTLALVNTWRYVGYVALLFFAGLQLIPKNLYEASALDGASEYRMFRHITLPLLKPIMAFVLVTTTIGSLQVFDIIQVTTEGGPVNATEAFYPYIYRTAFVNLDLGYASAIAVVFMVVIGILSALSLKISGASESDMEGA